MTKESKFKITISIVLGITILWTAFNSVLFYNITKLNETEGKANSSDYMFAEF